jgi:type I restriction enzyme S subunit
MIANVPKGWEVRPLGELADFINGMAFKPSDWESEGLPIIRIQNLNGSLEFNYYNKPVDARNYVNTGDLLFSWSGSRGTSFGPFVWNNRKGILNQHIFRVAVNKGVDKGFLYHQLKHITEIIERRAHGSAGLVHVTKRELEKFQIILPREARDQKRIAEILSTWDRAIETLEKLIESKTHLKKSLMQRLLTGRDRYNEFKSDQFDRVPLGQVAKVNMGQSPESEFYNEAGEGLPLIQGNADCKNRRTVPTTYTTQITKTAEVGDIIMSVRAPVGTVARSAHQACIGRGVCAIKGEKVDNEYLYQFLLFFEPRWGQYAQGSTFTAVNGNDIKKLSLELPATGKEQKKIAKTLSSADREIELLSSMLDTFKFQKKGLMQKLLTGKFRVRV